MVSNDPAKIHSVIERFFIISAVFILTAVLLMGLYFNRYATLDKQEDNLFKVHAILSQLIIPSLIISDVSEVKHLLYMSSKNSETFLVIDNFGTIIMSDYEKASFSHFASSINQGVFSCNSLNMAYKKIDGKKYLINCSVLHESNILNKSNKVGLLLSFSEYQ